MPSEGPKERLAFRVLNNSLAFMGGEFFYHFVNFLTGILVARRLQSESYGQFSFIFVYLSFFDIFAQFGLNSILTREVAQGPENAPRILGNAVLLRFILIACALPLAFLGIGMMGYPPSIRQGVLLGSLQLFLGLRTVYETVFRVNLLMIYPALWNGLRALINLGLVALVSWFRPSVSWFVLAYLGGGLVSLAGTAFSSHRVMPLRLEWDFRLIKEMIRQSVPLVFASYLTTLYYRIDVFMLSVMKSFKDIGYYSVATRLTESLDVVATALMVSLFPLLSRSFKEDRGHFDRLLIKSFKGLLLVGLPMALGGVLVAHELIVLFFGPEYSPSGVTLAILLWYTLFGFFSTILVNVLIACGRQVIDLWISLCLVLANVGLNLILIPLYSYNGAAVATVLVEILGTVAMLTYLARKAEIRFLLPFQEIWPVLVINLFFFLVLIFLKTFLALTFFPFVASGVLLYLVLLLGARLVTWSDLKSYFSYGARVLTKEDL